MDERIAVLEQKYNQLASKIESTAIQASPKKDLWDIISATTPLLTGLLISGIGLYFAYTNNQAQLKLQETQTVEKFIPHLIGSEPEKKAAIIALSTITNTTTAAKYAEIFASEGTASALKSLATSSNTKDSDKKVATRALANTFHQMADGYQATQNPLAAAQAYQQSLNAQEKLVGKEAPELVDNLNQLAQTYKAERKYDLSELALKRILKIEEKTNGSRSPQFITTLNQLAQVYKLDGKTDTANHLSDYAGLLAKQITSNPSANTANDANTADSQNPPVSTSTPVQQAQQANLDQNVSSGEAVSNTNELPDNKSPLESNPTNSSSSKPDSVPVKDTNSKSTNPLSAANNSQKSTL